MPVPPLPPRGEDLIARLGRLQIITDAVPSLMAYVSPDERYAAANRAHGEWFDRDPDQLIGCTLLDSLGEETYRTIEPYVRRALSGEQVTFEAVIPYRSDVRHVEATYVPDRAQDGSIIGYVALTTDISDRKKLEAELRHQAASRAALNRIGQYLTGQLDLEKLVQAVTDAATELSGAEFGAFFYNVLDDSGESYMLYTLSGAPREAFAGFPMPRNTAIFEPTFRGIEIVRLDDVTEDPRYGKSPPHYGMPKGHLPVRSYLAVPVLSRSGEVLGGLFFGHSRRGVFTSAVESLIATLAAQAAIAIDNSRLFAAVERQRRAAEDSARRSQFLSDASRTLAASFDISLSFAQVARLAAQTLGTYCTIDMLDEGRLISIAAAHADSARQRATEELRKYQRHQADASRWWLAMQQGASQVLPELDDEFFLRASHDGHQQRLLHELGLHALVIVPLMFGGGPLGTLTVGWTSPKRFDDDDVLIAEELAYRISLTLSNARLFQQAQDASRLKDEFLAVVSHELRTPLNAIRGWTSLLRTTKLDQRQTEHALGVIDRNISAQTQLIEDLLDISRIVSGRMRLNVQPVDVASVVKSAIDSIEPAAAAKQIRLEPVLDPGSGPVWGDPARLQQIAWNLLSNAIKFTPRQGRVQIRLRRLDSHVELAVADSGQGIAPAFLPHVFDRFRQGDSTTTRAVGGLGLGLAIVRHLVELHGGSVDAVSPGEGQGATFTVRLPVMVLHRRKDDYRMPVEREPQRVDIRLDGARVLCVDDDEETCEVLSVLLKNVGSEVRTATSVAEAMTIVETWHPDVVISDIEMPGEDGYALVRRIRALEAGTGRRTLAIAVTAYARTDDRVRALSAGFQSHLPKPVEPAELLAVLGSLLGRHPSKGNPHPGS
jgi:PAS domain S-box-containing protein